MTYTRLTGALSALALAFVLGACSTTDDLAPPMLTPQFGTADNDQGVDVASVSTDRIYLLSGQYGSIYSDGGSGEGYENGLYQKALLRRYTSSGTLTWTKEILSNSCTYDEMDYDGCPTYMARSLEADLQGNVYATLSYEYDAGDCVSIFRTYVEKYNAAGDAQNSTYLGGTGGEFGEAYDTVTATAIDGSGNVYATFEKANVDSWDCTSSDRTTVIAKYSTNGSLIWQRTSTVGATRDIAVSSSGSIYVVGTKGIARYSNSGGLTWTKPGIFGEVIISGSSLYTRYLTTLYKYDSSGRQLWKKTQSGLSGMAFQDMTGDGSGNVYLSGKYSATSTNRNAFTRKLNASGSVLWTKTFGTSAYDDARAIATISGSEIYTTGITRGALSHSNVGGEDGYLRKTNSSGNRVWTR